MIIPDFRSVVGEISKRRKAFPPLAVVNLGLITLAGD